MQNALRNKLLKIFSLFVVIRGYNILVIVWAQIVSSVFIFSTNPNKWAVLFDYRLWLIVMASAAAISGGYVVNHFFDADKDLINRPQKTLIEQHISTTTKWTVYVLLCVLSLVFASVVSPKALLFFVLYQLALLLYSYKLSRLLLVGNVVSALLAITPFFAITVYYHNLSAAVFVHAAFLFLLILIREGVKDLENLSGDFMHKYQTIPVVLGENHAKKFLKLYIMLALGVVYILVSYFPLGAMQYYFYFCVFFLSILLFTLQHARSKKHYIQLHVALKIVIVMGVMSIYLLSIPTPRLF